MLRLNSLEFNRVIPNIGHWPHRWDMEIFWWVIWLDVHPLTGNTLEP